MLSGLNIGMPHYVANNTTTHLHHVIPKHMGGLDEPSNLVELSIQDHAEAHKWLFIEHGRVEDALAWLGLYGQIDRQTAQREAITSAMNRPEVKEKLAAMVVGDLNPSKRDVVRKKLSDSAKGDKNPWYGKKRPDHSAFMAGDTNPSKRPEVRAKIRESLRLRKLKKLEGKL